MGPPSLPGVGARGWRTEGLVGYTPEEGAVWTPGWEAVLSRVRMYRSEEKAEEALGQAPRGSLHRLWNKEAEPPPGLPWSGEEGGAGRPRCAGGAEVPTGTYKTATGMWRTAQGMRSIIS